ncbi:MAG: hypothetical protein IT384_14895 [Deltaproteobacteria bacterium]|nr:hypothetical protein [Deltaproteobacteria bacterium]
MPLTEFQAEVARLLSRHRSEDSHLAGGAALHLEPNSKRFSNDLDYFHDSEVRVASAFDDDRKLLEGSGYVVVIEMNQPGYIRAVVSRDEKSTKVEWAHDSAWRFMPAVQDARVGWRLHPIDLAVNKVLALAGRDEPRDFLDIMEIDREILPLGALCWAATGKDPGFTPRSLLELLRRRGRYQREDFARLRLTEPVDLPALKARWLQMLDDAEAFIRSRPLGEVGCLYWSPSERRFVAPRGSEDIVVPHHGRPGGVLPRNVPRDDR